MNAEQKEKLAREFAATVLMPIRLTADEWSCVVAALGTMIAIGETGGADSTVPPEKTAAMLARLRRVRGEVQDQLDKRIHEAAPAYGKGDRPPGEG